MPFKLNLVNTIIPVMVFSFFTKAQENFLGHTIHFTPRANPAQTVDTAFYRQLLYAKYSSLPNKSLLPGFAALQINDKQNYYHSNHDYNNWDSLDNYLARITDKIYKSNNYYNRVDVKVIRDPSVNAYSFEDGSIRINIGLLAAAANEAELVAVLGHEIGHVVKRHSYQRYEINHSTQLKNYQASRFGLIGLGVAVSNVKGYSNFLVEQEEESDNYAIDLLRQSGYNYGGFYSLFNRFISMDEKAKAKNGGTSFSFFKTHPRPANRLEHAQTQGPPVDRYGKNFMVDSVFFVRMQQQAIDESIHLYFETLDLEDCLELAFKQHLRAPEDPFYLFYLTECTRRLLALDNELGDQDFITTYYKKNYSVQNPVIVPQCILPVGKVPGKPTPVVENTIYNKLTGPLLGIDEQELATYKNKKLVNTDTIEFITYKEAYAYFKNENNRLGFELNNFYDNGDIDEQLSQAYYHDSTLSHQQCVALLPWIIQAYHSNTSGKILWLMADLSYRHVEIRGLRVELNDNKQPVVDALMKYRNDNGLWQTIDHAGSLNYYDFNALGSIYGNMAQWLAHHKNGNQEVYKLDLRAVMPELYLLASNNNNVSGIVFSTLDVNEKTEYSLGIGVDENYWQITNYYFDLKHNRITYLRTTLSNKLKMGKQHSKDFVKDYFKTLSETTTLTGNQN